ncbi:glycosyltransferase [Leptospira sp. WS60.C2]
MKTSTIISIVTPSYNQGQFIRETIESVINQKGEFYLDYIIVDGASNDNTVDIIREYDETFKKRKVSDVLGDLVFRESHSCKGVSFRWMSERDKGPVDALNKGIKLIIGNYFLWLNSDDRYSSNDSINNLLIHFMENALLDVVSGDGYFIDSKGYKTGKHQVSRINLKECIFLDYHILQPSTMIKTSILDVIKFDVNFLCVFDCDFFIRVFDKYSWLKINSLISDYRFWGGNITDTMHKQRFKEHLILAWRLSKRVDYFLISLLYLYSSLILKNRFKNSSLVSAIIWFIKKLSYFYVTGKSRR